jgi:hypothetical protein
MAFVTGYVTAEQKQKLEDAGYEVEDAKDYNLVGSSPSHLLAGPEEGDIAVSIFVDCDVMDLLSLGD